MRIFRKNSLFAMVKYPQHISSINLQYCDPEVILCHSERQLRKQQEFPATITAVGFSRWKQQFITSFLKGSDVTFMKKFDEKSSSDQQETLALWGSINIPELPETSSILRIEDGFLRSVGLGADLVHPLSLVIDDMGIYYDATSTSRLEYILQNEFLNTKARNRARALRDRLEALDLTKYNLGKQPWKYSENDQRLLLVVGQVETDASIRLGSTNIDTNIKLLQRVRHENPSAYIIYKPHPDVVAGLRKRGKNENESIKIANEVIDQPVALNSLLTQIDEVHTMTSLLGFEALLRGAKVVCHGLPFYAGWGLTEDRVSCERRNRLLSLEDLVHGTLISYPRYISYECNCFIEPEQAIDQLVALAKTKLETGSFWRKFLRLGILLWLKIKGHTQ